MNSKKNNLYAFVLSFSVLQRSTFIIKVGSDNIKLQKHIARQHEETVLFFYTFQIPSIDSYFTKNVNEVIVYDCFNFSTAFSHSLFIFKLDMFLVMLSLVPRHLVTLTNSEIHA